MSILMFDDPCNIRSDLIHNGLEFFRKVMEKTRYCSDYLRKKIVINKTHIEIKIEATKTKTGKV